MPFELVHFRGSDKIIKERKMKKELHETLDYIDTVLFGAPNRGELLKQALADLGWRENGLLTILDDRGYRLKGFKNGIAIEGSFSAYEFILEGMLRLQLAYDKGKIHAGVLLLTSLRSDKSKFGTSRELCEHEVEHLLHPTISLPVSVALFDLGESRKTEKEGEREDLTELKKVHERKVRTRKKKEAKPEKPEQPTEPSEPSPAENISERADSTSQESPSPSEPSVRSRSEQNSPLNP